MRLFILLTTQNISPAKGQKSNVVESSIRRIKLLWRTAFKDVRKLTRMTVLDMDFLLNSICSDLSRIPLNPEVSNIAPSDFLVGYKSVPMTISLAGRNQAEKTMCNIRKGYEMMCKFYKELQYVPPYLWQAKGAGKLRRSVQLNDIVYIESLNRLGQVFKTASNQLKVGHKDELNSYHHNWFPKSSLTLMPAGSLLYSGPPPRHWDQISGQ